MGTIFAYEQKAYLRWARSTRRPPKARGLTGAALEAAVMQIAETFPDNVIVGR